MEENKSVELHSTPVFRTKLSRTCTTLCIFNFQLAYSTQTAEFKLSSQNNILICALQACLSTSVIGFSPLERMS